MSNYFEDTLIAPKMFEMQYNTSAPSKEATLSAIYNLVLQFFQGDRLKTRQWFITPNPFLGNFIPRLMIMSGKIDRLYKFVQNTITENNYTQENSNETSY